MRSASRRPPEISEPIQATGCQRLGGSPSARSRATARSRTATRARWFGGGLRPPSEASPREAAGTGEARARSGGTSLGAKARKAFRSRASGDRRRWAAARVADVAAGSRAVAPAGGIGPLPARHRRASDAWTRRPWSRRARGRWARGPPRPRRVRRAPADEPRVGRRPAPGFAVEGSPDTARTLEARRCALRPYRRARAAIHRPRPPPVPRRQARRSPLPFLLRLRFLPAR